MRILMVMGMLVLAGASVVLAQAPEPISAAPALKIVTSTNPEKGLILFQETTVRVVPIVKQVVRLVNGKEVTETVTASEMVQESRAVEIDVAKGRVITREGKQLPIDEVWKRIKANTVVAVSSDGSTPAPAFLGALRADTLIVVPASNVPMKPNVPLNKKRF